MFWIRMFLLSYIVTVVAEEAVSLLWNTRSLKAALTVLWVNTVTNPCVVALRYLSNQAIASGTVRSLIMLVLELSVLLIEWRLYRKFLKGCRRPFLFSLSVNAASYGAGLLIPVIMPLLLAPRR